MTSTWKTHSLSTTLVAITSMALGVAAGYFWLGARPLQQPVSTQPKEPNEAAATYRTAKPIIGNLAEPATVWIRLDLAFLLDPSIADNDANILIARMSEDTLAFLRTMRMSDLEGPSGLAHLREDISDRAKIRSDGKVTSVIIRSMILQ